MHAQELVNSCEERCLDASLAVKQKHLELHMEILAYCKRLHVDFNWLYTSMTSNSCYWWLPASS